MSAVIPAEVCLYTHQHEGGRLGFVRRCHLAVILVSVTFSCHAVLLYQGICSEVNKPCPPYTSSDRSFPIADGSGALDHEELTPLLRELGVFTSTRMENDAKKKQNVFPQMDLDCSGSVRREEFASWVKKVTADVGFYSVCVCVRRT